MIYILIAAVALSIVVSASCSLMEAALYAVPLPYVRHYAEGGGRSGKILLRFKEDMARPIAAILILNTIANTAGASVAGWAVGELFASEGGEVLVVFSVLFTLSILYFSEIIPKTVGVIYSKPVARLVAVPLRLLVTVFSPLIWISERLSRGIRTNEEEPTVSEQEFLSMAALGTEEGALDHFEGSVITNVVGLDRLLVRDVLTPRVVVFREREDKIVGDLETEIVNWNYSRVPLYGADNPDYLCSYVTQRDIYRDLLQGNRQVSLKSISRPLITVPEVMRADKLLLQMFEDREHICAVVDEHGGLAGIITLEDIIEEIVGREIVDEYDTVSDLRTFAKILWFTKKRRKKGRT